MYLWPSILLVGCLMQLVSAGVLRSHLSKRDGSRAQVQANCPTPSALSSGTLNLTLPDPDPSVNATLQYLPTGNTSVYIVENSTSLQNIAADDTNSGTATHRRSLSRRVLSLFKRAGSGIGESAGDHDEGSDGASNGAYSYTGSSTRPSSEGSGGSWSSIPGTGFSKPIDSDSEVSDAKPPTSPDATSPATGFLAKVAVTDQREVPVRLPLLAVLAAGSTAHAAYYNDAPASNWTRDNATYLSPPSYYTEFGFSNYDSTIFWFDYKYQDFYSWFYPAYMYMPSDSANPGIGGIVGNLTDAEAISTTPGFEDPLYSNISSSQGVVTYGSNGTLHLVNGTDQSNFSIISWTGDHLLETGLIPLFFNSSAAANASVDWASIWDQIESCHPWGTAVTAILNVPSNLVGLDVTLNRIKTVLLTSPDGPSAWDRSPAFYQALYSYMTIILPNYMATAQAIDTLFGQISDTPDKTENVFLQWAYDVFYNATYSLSQHTPNNTGPIS